jgi:hypothetical protein
MATFTKFGGEVVELNTQAKLDGMKLACDGSSHIRTWPTAECVGEPYYVSAYIKGELSAEARAAYRIFTRAEKLGQGLDFAGF